MYIFHSAFLSDTFQSCVTHLFVSITSRKVSVLDTIDLGLEIKLSVHLFPGEMQVTLNENCDVPGIFNLNPKKVAFL